MNQNIEKLIKLSGDSNCYQYLSLILIFFLWANTYILSVTLPLLERPPLVTFNDTNITVPINYTICEWNNYTITEHFNYSWVSEFHIYCDKTKTGLLGSISSFGFMSGSFLFSFVSKVVSHKTNIMISLSLFIVFKTISLNIGEGVPVMAQWLTNPTSIHEGRRFNPWPCSVD